MHLIYVLSIRIILSSYYLFFLSYFPLEFILEVR